MLLSSLAYAADDENAFAVRVASIGQARDYGQWQGLFCEARKESSSDAHAVKYFTSASLSAPKYTKHKDAMHELSVCFESPTAKEMCVVFAVSQKAGHLCLLQP